MKHFSYRISVAVLLIAGIHTTLNAQDNRNSYFLDNNLYSYRINPAISSEKPFVGFIINNIGIEAKSNVGVSSLLFPRNGQLVTGLNSAVSADEFLGKLKKITGLSTGLDENLLSFGFDCGAGNAFSTVEINLRTSVSAGIPKTLFEFLKVGSKADPYNVSGTRINANSYLEVAYGYSRDINESIRVGGRVKALIGAGNITLSMPDAAVCANEDVVYLKGNAEFEVAAPYVSFKNNDKGYIDIANPIVSNKFGLGGWGIAVDLGATWKPFSGLEVSASIVDLGGLSWKRNVHAKSSASAEYTGVEFNLNDNSQISRDLDEALAKLSEILNLKETSDKANRFEMLPCTINAGARYRMPFYDRLSAGILAGYKTNSYVGWFDIKGGLTITPIDWFSLCGTLGYNSYCPTWGAAMSLNFLNLNFFASIESYLGNLASIKVDNSTAIVPVNTFREQINFGLNITFGQRRTHFIAGPHKKKE